MKTIKLMMTFCLFVILLSCDKSDEETFIPTPVNYTIKYRGELGGFDYYPNSPDTQTIKISSNVDYTNYITSLQQYPITTHDEVYNFNPSPDFTSNDILVINYKCNGDLGKRIEINSIIENENEIVIRYFIYSGEYIMTTSGKPFILLEIPKTTKPITIIDETNL